LIDNLIKNVNWIEKGLDAAWLKNQVISNNIANADTEGFKSSSVEFESAFKKALAQDRFVTKQTREKHIDFNNSVDDLSATVVTDRDTTMLADGNNVDLDYENAELAKNTIYYNTLVQQLASEFRRLNMAVRGD